MRGVLLWGKNGLVKVTIGVCREPRAAAADVEMGPIGGGLGLGLGIEIVVPEPVLPPPRDGAGLPLPDEAEGEWQESLASDSDLILLEEPVVDRSLGLSFEPSSWSWAVGRPSSSSSSLKDLLTSLRTSVWICLGDNNHRPFVRPSYNS